VLEIRDGRHPVVERMGMKERFIPNDTYLDDQENQMVILTGPNMAGKSTYIRQVAIITLMAQVGSFVPASEATIGVVDRIFTRVGASDSLSRGQSTFMVEMVETANILNNATRQSLVILDEIGRGTSTFDGVSIAWAIAEFLVENPRLGPKTLFATHYHEMTELALTHTQVKNFNVSVKEWNDQIIFLRKIVPGGSNRSYGIQVGRLAGLPPEVIQRAKEILGDLEKGAVDEGGNIRLASLLGGNARNDPQQMSLFVPYEDRLREALKKIDLQTLTPLEALNKLDELQKMIEENHPATKTDED